MQGFSNILIIKPGAIGDLLQLTPVIRATKQRFPDARISILVGNHASTDIFKHHPLVHEIIVFEKAGEHRSPGSLFKLWRRLRYKRYDMVLNFQRSNLKAWFLASAAFPCRVFVYHKARNRIVHAVANHLEVLQPLGIDVHDQTLEFYPGSVMNQYAIDLFEAEGWAGKTVIAINPGASHPVNRWGAAKFAELSDILAEKLQAQVVIVGGREDEPLSAEILSRSRFTPTVLTGKTSLLQLGAILKKCALLVSGDTGPMHMATAVGTRVVALFGPADPDRTGPVGCNHRVIQAREVECVPCRSRKCDNSLYLECMENISVERVLQEIETMLGERNQQN